MAHNTTAPGALSLADRTTIDFGSFREGLLRLFREDDDGSVSRHTLRYTRLVLEVAAKSGGEEELSPDVRTFAAYFTGKPPAYSRTLAGKSALLFETWLVEKGGTLFDRFLETVLESSTEYRAVFHGKLTEQELEVLELRTREFVRFKVEVRAGDRDHARGLISDVTILRCTASGAAGGKAKELLDPKEKRSIDSPRTGPVFSESLLPGTLEGYGEVGEDGLTSEALTVVFGCNPFGDVSTHSGYLSVSDPNGVRWESDDGAGHWRPSRVSVEEVFDGSAVEEEEFSYAPVVEVRPPALPAPASPLLYEVSDSGAVRSCFGTWVVLEAPVDASSRTVVGLREGAFAVSHDEADVVEAVHTLLELYREHPFEGDLVVEAALREYADEWGWPVRNPEVVRALLEGHAVPLADRDAHLRERYPFGCLEAASVPEVGAEEEEEETTDRMDEPEFYRDDLQTYYDLLVTTGATEAEAKAKLRQKFKVTGIVITPTGEVRAPGVVDRPDPPAPMPPAPMGQEPAGEPEAPASEPEPEGGQEAGQGAQEAAVPLAQEEAEYLSAWVGSPRSSPIPVGLLRDWSRLVGVPEQSLREAWAGSIQGLREGGELEPYQEAAGRVKAGLHFAGSEALPAGSLPLPSLDDAFLYFLTYEDDASASEFPEWVEARCPHLAAALQAWSPVETPLHEGRLDDREMYRALVRGGKGTGQRTAKRKKSPPQKRERRCSRTMSEAQGEAYEKWKRLTNVRSSVLFPFLRSRAFLGAMENAPRTKRSPFELALESARHLFRMRATPVKRWTGTDWNWCGRQTKFIERLRGTGTPLVEDGRLTRKYLLLKAWGYDAGVRGCLAEDEIVDLLERDPSRACRAIDSLPGPAPHYVGDLDEYAAAGKPSWDVLKRNRKQLTPEEKRSVMSREATWHRGPEKSESPAVWKSVIKGKPWFVTNTHRAFNVCPTCKGAIGRYHRFIKRTA